jgi:hypothetical protein
MMHTAIRSQYGDPSVLHAKNIEKPIFPYIFASKITN